ncbi:MAG: transposase, partial [Verrucomicrobiales bacterium]|nr:transposase [Verrucomicrobiales bacterium]
QEGVTYFVTFRQADSIPRSVWEEMNREAQEWTDRIVNHVKEHGELAETIALEWEAFQRRQWILSEQITDECHGSCLLADDKVRQIVVDALMFFEAERHTTHALVVMPNHVHLLVTPIASWALDMLTQSWKGFTSRQINRHLGRKGPLWQPESFDRIVRHETHFERVASYIMANPTKAKLTGCRSTVGIAEACVKASPDSLHEWSPTFPGDEW